MYAKMVSLKARVISAILYLLGVALAWWLELPALNLRSPGLWQFVFWMLIAAAALEYVLEMMAARRQGTYIKAEKGSRLTRGLFGAAGTMIVLALVLGVIAAELFHSPSYQSLIVAEDGDFAADVAELSMSQIPVVDHDTAAQLGKRKLGNMSDLVSQFEISGDYTQINYQDRPVRVTPLEYGDIIKWFNNTKQGLPAYIQVDMVTQETTLVRLEQGMKYAPCEYFNRDLTRYLRFRYPTAIFDSYNFEIDDSGIPYWIVPTTAYRIGMWGGQDIGGVITVNAVSGETMQYALEDVPDWVDRVYGAGLVVEQMNWNGKYRSGFWNSIFGQKGVLQTTDGYNYIAVNDDVYLYTGMTSAASDESNVGFVLINMRTKETKYYGVPGAEEYSAMSSAEGKVQNLHYQATFPLLLNIADRPTYFMSLKDDAGLVKMYAFVDVESYQLVGTGTTVPEAVTAYRKVLSQEDGVEVAGEAETLTVTAVSSAVVEGNTRYYIRVAENEHIYLADITVSDALPFLKAGDTVQVTASGETARVITAIQ